MIPRLGGVTLSVLLHAGLIVLLLAWSAADWTRPLFVDLVERAESPGAPGRVAAPARSSRPAGRAAAPVPATSRAASRPAPAVPAPPVAPPLTPPAAPTPPMERVVSTPPPAPVVPAEPALPPPPPAAVVPPPPATPSVPSAADGRRGGSEGGPGSVTRSGGPTRDDAESGPGGAPGAALASPGGGSEGPPAEYGPYLRRFRQRVQESLIYPLAARQQGVGGTVELHVWLEATGRVRDVQVARSSSHRVLDDAAVETIRRLGPLPFPDSLPRRPLLIRLPLVYELR